ncbi:amidohydrolase family protein [Maricaulis sp. CAU 1757]
MFVRTLAAALLAAGGLDAALGQDLLIRDVTLISPERAGPVLGQSVLVRDGRIVAIGDAAGVVDAGNGVEIVEGEGRFLTPGLMDSHHHVSFVPGMGALDDAVAAGQPELAGLYMAQQPRSLLYHGVTQVLDPAPLQTHARFEAADLRPDYFRCGEIPTPEGYPGNQRQSADGETTYRYRLDATPDGAPEAVVARIAAEGGRCVKVYVENGFGAASDWPLFDDDLLGQIRDAAHSHGLPVLAHANAVDMMQIALRNELDILAHGMWNWQWPDGEAPVGETLDRVVADGTGYMPTLMVMDGISNQLRADTLADPALEAVVPGELMAWYRAGGADFFGDELAADFPPDMAREEMADIMQFAVGRGQRAAAYLHAAGHPLLLASDCPGSPSVANQPGLCTYREMRLLAEAGVSPEAILAAGTINNASAFGLDADYGTVEVGKMANLLLLEANPLDSVEAWDRIEGVVLHGRLIERDQLRAH